MTPTNTPESTAKAASDGAASHPDSAAGSAGDHVPPLDPTELSKDPV